MTHVAIVTGRRGKGLRGRKARQRKHELGALARALHAASKPAPQ